MLVRVDEAIGSDAVAALWRNKFNGVFNCVDDQSSRNEFLAKVLDESLTPVLGVTPLEVQSIVKRMANNKAVGLDSIPNEFYKSASQNVFIMISMLFNSFLNHAFLPKALMNVLIVPLLKGKLKDPCLSNCCISF